MEVLHGPKVDKATEGGREKETSLSATALDFAKDLDLDPETLKQVLRDTLAGSLVEGMNLEARRAAEDFDLRVSQWDKPSDPVVVDWARANSGKRVVEISEGTREGIATAIARGIEEGRGVDGTARDVRQLIGLNSQRASAVLNYRARLESAGASNVDGKVERYTKGQLKARSLLIANTETNIAVSHGQFVKAKALGREEKEWLTVGDDRVSQEICEPNELEGRVPIEHVYTTSGTQTTPGHVMCRCSCAFFGSTKEQVEEELQTRTGP